MLKSDFRDGRDCLLFAPRAGEALADRASLRAHLLAAAREGVHVRAEIYSSAFPVATGDSAGFTLAERIALCELLSYADSLYTDEAAAINIIGMTPDLITATGAAAAPDDGTLREALIARFGLSECTVTE